MGSYRGRTKRQQRIMENKANKEFELFLGLLALPFLPVLLLLKLLFPQKRR